MTTHTHTDRMIGACTEQADWLVTAVRSCDVVTNQLSAADRELRDWLKLMT